MRLNKWIKLYQNPNYKPPTPKQLERLKIREQKLMKELYETDFYEITWHKKCVESHFMNNTLHYCDEI